MKAMGLNFYLYMLSLSLFLILILFLSLFFRMADYENYISSERYSKSKLSDEDAKDTEDLKMAITEDKTFSKFKQRVSIEPDQVCIDQALIIFDLY